MLQAQELETKLDEIFNKNAPQLPIGFKRFIYKWAPWAALVVGILSLLSAYSLWNGARGVSQSSYYVQQVCSTYQSTSSHCNVPSVASHLGFWLWLAIITTIIQGVLYLRAFPRLREFKKSGWDYVYYAALVNVAYAVVTLLTGYNVVGHFIGSLLGLAISFYVLFQIRSLYVQAPVEESYQDKPQAPVTLIPAATQPPVLAVSEPAAVATDSLKPARKRVTAKKKTTSKKSPARKRKASN